MGLNVLEHIHTRSCLDFKTDTTDIPDGFSAVDKLHKKTRRKEKRTGRTYTRAAAERTKSDQVTTRCLTSESILSELANKTKLIYFFLFSQVERESFAEQEKILYQHVSQNASGSTDHAQLQESKDTSEKS